MKSRDIFGKANQKYHGFVQSLAQDAALTKKAIKLAYSMDSSLVKCALVASFVATIMRKPTVSPIGAIDV